MNMDSMDLKRTVTIAGAFIAFLLGSGFATGQEIMQYFASYGYLGIGGAILTLLLLMYVGVSFIGIGYENKFEKGSDIFKYYCGNKLGTFFDYFSILLMYLSFIVMVAGASATFNQHFGLPNFAGAVTMTVLAGATVLMGLNKLVDIIGKIGPVIILLSIILGLMSTFSNIDGLMEVSAIIPELDLTQASYNWFFAAGSYVGLCMLWLAGFLAAIGSSAGSKKEAVFGAASGAIGYSLAIVVVSLGLMACIKDVGGSQIPTLILAGKIHPGLATAFSVIIVAGIYTTAVPLLWSVSSRFTLDKSTNFKLLTIVLAVIGLAVGTGLSFAKLVNVVYVLNGYVGILLLVIMLIKSGRRMMAKETRRFEESTKTGKTVQRM